MRTIEQIIADAGGARAIEAAAPIGADGKPCFKTDAVYKWPSIGIPDRHWPILIKLASATPEELFQANLAARQGAAA